jgi:hypothetical protein
VTLDFLGLGKVKEVRLQGDIRISLEPLYGHLLETPGHDILHIERLKL